MCDAKHRLIDCQHCGDINIAENKITGQFTVYCSCGFAHRKVGWFNTEREAIRAWDRVCLDWEG